METPVTRQERKDQFVTACMQDIDAVFPTAADIARIQAIPDDPRSLTPADFGLTDADFARLQAQMGTVAV